MNPGRSAEAKQGRIGNHMSSLERLGYENDFLIYRPERAPDVTINKLQNKIGWSGKFLQPSKGIHSNCLINMYLCQDLAFVFKGAREGGRRLASRWAPGGARDGCQARICINPVEVFNTLCITNGGRI